MFFNHYGGLSDPETLRSTVPDHVRGVYAHFSRKPSTLFILIMGKMRIPTRGPAMGEDSY